MANPMNITLTNEANGPAFDITSLQEFANRNTKEKLILSGDGVRVKSNLAAKFCSRKTYRNTANALFRGLVKEFGPNIANVLWNDPFFKLQSGKAISSRRLRFMLAVAKDLQYVAHNDLQRKFYVEVAKTMDMNTYISHDPNDHTKWAEQHEMPFETYKRAHSTEFEKAWNSKKDEDEV